MSLSIETYLLLPHFLIPAAIVPSNRMKVYFVSSLLSALPAGILLAICLLLPDSGLVQTLSSLMEPSLSFLLLPGMSLAERQRICILFFLLSLYFLVYAVSYILQKIFFLGSNVTIQSRPTKVIRHVVFATFFFLCTYLFLVVFLAGIRQLLPLPDGFLSPLFDFLFPLEA